MKKKRMLSFVLLIVLLLTMFPLNLTASSADEPNLYYGNAKFNGLTVKKNIYRDSTMTQNLKTSDSSLYSKNGLSDDEFKMYLKSGTSSAENKASSVNMAVYTRKDYQGLSYYNAFQSAASQKNNAINLDYNYIYTIKPISSSEFKLYHYENGKLVSDNEDGGLVKQAKVKAGITDDGTDDVSKRYKAADYIGKFNILFPYCDEVTDVLSIDNGTFYMCDGDQVDIQELSPKYYFVSEENTVLESLNKDNEDSRSGKYDTDKSGDIVITNTNQDVLSQQLTTDNSLTYEVKNYFDKLPTKLTVKKNVNYFDTKNNPMNNDTFHFKIHVNDSAPTDMTYSIYDSGKHQLSSKTLTGDTFELKANQYIEFDCALAKNDIVEIWEMLTDDKGIMYNEGRYIPVTADSGNYNKYNEKETDGKIIKTVYSKGSGNVKEYTFTNVPNALVVKKNIQENKDEDPNKANATFTYKIMGYVSNEEYTALSDADKALCNIYRSSILYTRTINLNTYSALSDKTGWEDDESNKYNKTDNSEQITAEVYNNLSSNEKSNYVADSNNQYILTIDEIEYLQLSASEKAKFNQKLISEYTRPLTESEMLNISNYVFSANSEEYTLQSQRKDTFSLKNGEIGMVVGLDYDKKYVITEVSAFVDTSDITSNYIVTSPQMPLATRALESTRNSIKLSNELNIFDNLYQPKNTLAVSKVVNDNDSRARKNAVYLFRLEKQKADKSGYEAVGNAEYKISGGTTVNPDNKTDAGGYFTMIPASFGEPVRAEFTKLSANTIYRAVEIDPNQRQKTVYTSGISNELITRIGDNIPFYDPNHFLLDTDDFFAIEVESGGSSSVSSTTDTDINTKNIESGDVKLTPTSTNNHVSFTNTVNPCKYKFNIEKLLYKDITFNRTDNAQRFVFKIERFSPEDTEMKTVLETLYIDLSAGNEISDSNIGVDYLISNYDSQTSKTTIQYDTMKNYSYNTKIYQGIKTVSVQKKGWYKITEITDWSYTDYNYVEGSNRYKKGKTGASAYLDSKNPTSNNTNNSYVAFSISDVYDSNPQNYPTASFSNVESEYAYFSGSAYAENVIKINK